MGLDMVPIGKPKPGSEKRFRQIFNILNGNEQTTLSFFDKLRGRKLPNEEELQKEWFDIQIPSYETLGAPMVGRDAAANQWIKEKYQQSDKRISEDEFIKMYQGYYVITLAKHNEGIPAYGSMSQDENAFRGQLLDGCSDLINESLINEAWVSKMADDALDYGKRLSVAITTVAKERGLEHLLTPDSECEYEVDSVEDRICMIAALSRWLIFYGSHGHGYIADY